MNIFNDFGTDRAIKIQTKNTAAVKTEKPANPIEQTKNDSFEKEPPIEKEQSKPKDIAKFLESKVKNPDDINDTVTMPRAIFKGYLCFTAGTAIGSIASSIKDKPSGKILNAASAALSILGTYNFVKPFIYKGEKNNNKEN